MSENSVNPKDVEQYMTSIGFEWNPEAEIWHKDNRLYLPAAQAAFLYQQTLLARIDECKKAPAGSAMRKRRLAELTQLLQGSHNREEEK